MKKDKHDKIEKEEEDILNNKEDITEPKEEKIEEEKELSYTDKIENLGEKLEEINDKYLRLYSDFENFRKRTSKEKLDLIKFAAESTIKDLLPVIDDYERAIEDFNNQNSIPETSKEGLMLIYTKLINLLAQKGVTEIEAKGEKFDENLHEAITQFPASDETQKGCVIEVVLKGYMMYDKVIRYSKVVVAI